MPAGVGARCLFSCPPGFAPWGLVGAKCVFSEAGAWSFALLPDNTPRTLASVWEAPSVWDTAPSGAAFPSAPQCVRVAPLAPGQPTVLQVCQQQAALSWQPGPAQQPLSLPPTSYAWSRQHFSWLLSLPVGVSGGASSGVGSAALAPSAAFSGANVTALAQVLRQQWIGLHAAVATGLSFYAVFPHVNGTQAEIPAAVQGSVAAYSQATGQSALLATVLDPALVPRGNVVGMPVDTLVSFTVRAGNAWGMSSASTESRPVQFSSSECGAVAFSARVAGGASLTTDANKGNQPPPIVFGASKTRAHDRRLLQSGPGVVLDARVGTLPPDLTWPEVPQQPGAPTADKPMWIGPSLTPRGVVMGLSLSDPPGRFERVDIACSVARLGAGDAPPALAVVPEAVTGWGDQAAPQASSTSPDLSNLEFQLLAPWDVSPSRFSELAGLHRVQCSIQSTLVSAAPASAIQVYAGLPNLELHVNYLPSIVPTVGDMLLQLPDGAWASSWTGSAPTAADLGQVEGATDGAAGAGTVAVLPGEVVAAESLPRSLAEVFRAARSAPLIPAPVAPLSPTSSLLEHFQYAPARAGAAPSAFFSMTVTGQQRIALVGPSLQGVLVSPPGSPVGEPRDRASQPFTFAPGVRAWLGDAEVNVSHVSCDGTVLLATTPSFAAMCPGGGASCTGDRAYRTLWIANPPIIPPGFLQLVEDTWQRRRAGLPPTCDWIRPGSSLYSSGLRAWGFAPTATNASARVVLAPGDVSGSSIACPGACPGLSAATTSDGSAASAPYSYGVYVTDQCVGFPPSGSLCFEPQFRSQCAFGAADDCEPCGEGAVCPGGYRRWPLPGYWADGEASPAGVMKCDPPQERCLGWDVDSASAACGVGYNTRAVACGACADGYFPEPSGACAACPEGVGFVTMLVFLGYFAAACLALFLATAAAIRVAVWLRGGTFSGGIVRAAEFVMWTVTTLQVLVQVGRSASPGLPEYLATLYARLNVFQFDSSSLLHPACYALGVFTMELMQLGGALALVCMSAGLTVWKHTQAVQRPATLFSCAGMWWGLSALKPWLRRAAFTLMTLLYPLLTNTAFTMLHCVPVAMDVTLEQSRSGVLQGPAVNTSSLRPQAAQSVSYRLASNTFYECFEGPHVTPFYLAILVVVLYVVGYPLMSFLWVRSRLQRTVRRSKAGPEYAALLVQKAKQEQVVSTNRRQKCRACLATAQVSLCPCTVRRTARGAGPRRRSKAVKTILHDPPTQASLDITRTPMSTTNPLLASQGTRAHRRASVVMAKANPAFGKAHTTKAAARSGKALRHEGLSRADRLQAMRRKRSKRRMAMESAGVSPDAVAGGVGGGGSQRSNIVTPGMHAPRGHDGELDQDEEEWLASRFGGGTGTQTPGSGASKAHSSLADVLQDRYQQALQLEGFAGMDAVRARQALLRERGAGVGSGPALTQTAVSGASKLVDDPLLSTAGSGGQGQGMVNPLLSGGGPSASSPVPERSRARPAQAPAPPSVCRLSLCCCLPPACYYVVCTVPQARLAACVRKVGQRLGCSMLRGAATPLQITRARLDSMLDSSVEVQAHIGLQHFVSVDYRPSKFFFRQADLLLLAVLSVVLVFMPGDSSASWAAGALAATLLPVLGLAAWTAAAQPYLRGHEWKGPVRVGALLVTAVAAVLNYVTVCTHVLRTCASSQPLVEGLSVGVVLLAAVLLAVLFVSFWRVLLSGAALEAALSRASAKRTRSPGSLPADPIKYQPGGNPLLQPSSAPRPPGTEHRRPLSQAPRPVALQPKPLSASTRKLLTASHTFASGAVADARTLATPERARQRRSKAEAAAAAKKAKLQRMRTEAAIPHGIAAFKGLGGRVSATPSRPGDIAPSSVLDKQRPATAVPETKGGPSKAQALSAFASRPVKARGSRQSV